MILVMAGGVLGFLAAILGLAAFDLGWLAALAIWLSGGPLGALLALAVSLERRSTAAPAPAQAPVLQQAA
jgi:hypothetical protein